MRTRTFYGETREILIRKLNALAVRTKLIFIRLDRRRIKSMTENDETEIYREWIRNKFPEGVSIEEIY